MAMLTIRIEEEAIKISLRVRAAQHGVSMEEEARRILLDALARPEGQTPLGQRLLVQFSNVASTDFEPPIRLGPRTPPAWD